MSEAALVWRRHPLQSMAFGIPALVLMPAAPRRALAAEEPLTALTDTEANLLRPILARLIPADENGPGALETGVTTFIDRQMATPWAEGDHFYAAGPFQAGTPTQGYQFSMTPAQLVRAGLARMAEVVAQEGRAFQDLDAAAQDSVLARLEKGELDLSPVPGPLFFQTLLDLALEGFFADPIYGGNRDMAGWRMVGFPGYYSSYVAEIERHNVPFRRPPQALADLARAHAEDAQHGLPPSPQQIGPQHQHGGHQP